MTTSLILVSLFLLALSALSLLMPWYTRQELFFGVTVLPEFRRTPSARRIARGYRLGICSVAAVALAIVLAMHRPVIALLAHIVGTCATLIAAHHVASRYASPRASAVEVDLSAASERMPGGMITALLPLLWFLSLGIWAAFDTARLPGRIIVHWGLHGPDRWVTTTPHAVLALIGLTGLGCLIVAATAYGVLHRSRRISTSGAAASSERRFRRLAVLLMLTVEYLLAVLPVLMLLDAPRDVMWTWLVVLWATQIAFLIRLVRAGQGGSRSQTSADSAGQGAPVGDRTDDSHWLGGIIYVNPADPALFVEKRMGIGWSLNFGNLWAWLLVAAVLVILVLRSALHRTPEVRAQAQTAPLSWLDSIEAGDYTQSWDAAAARFRNGLPEGQWVTRVSALSR